MAVHIGTLAIISTTINKTIVNKVVYAGNKMENIIVAIAQK